MVLGHGSTQNDSSAAPVYQHAAELRRRKIFAQVRESFWKQEPQIKKVLAEISAPRVFIVPLFISEGYFSNEVIPRELGFGEHSTPINSVSASTRQSRCREQALNTLSSEASERRRINSLPGQSGATTGQQSTPCRAEARRRRVNPQPIYETKIRNQKPMVFAVQTISGRAGRRAVAVPGRRQQPGAYLCDCSQLLL